MMRPSDPRFRQTINQISHNLESANETAQEGIYTFSHNYIGPCFAGIKNSVRSCTSACFPSREDQLRRRRRGRSSGRAEYDFDFYDDWDYDEDTTTDSLLGWGTDELDRLLAGSSGARGPADQPRRHRRMSYGARGGRRKSTALPNDERRDPTVIPSSSFLGFLERFPWRIGARGIRYRPSAADLQENPGGTRRDTMESEPLIEGSDESDMDGSKDDEGLPTTKTRLRSGTQSSRETSNSLSSRGDLLPSDEEEDAVPLDDEFAMTLGRRDTWGSGLQDAPPASRSASGISMKTTESSKDSRTSGKGKGKRRKNRRRTVSSKSPKSPVSDGEMRETTQIPSLLDLKREEEQVRYKEEMEIDRKRQAAQKLARERGLSVDEDNGEPVNENDDISQDPQREQQLLDDATHKLPSSQGQGLHSTDIDKPPNPVDNRDPPDQEP
ncbi:hypothetical protein I7I53_08098 [Histoplasma capsulatum var. duboisii H88]|uniref:Uncharacterized protein n=2 Tax=Ajellomyces capsulatus (strain H88) TaxID=544711 RepID=A0A8A1LII9_AJEC8|nr:hypothetical protein I7I53_08098 [Histoplasma capsulatum var. duboisii H88]